MVGSFDDERLSSSNALEMGDAAWGALWEFPRSIGGTLHRLYRGEERLFSHRTLQVPYHLQFDCFSNGKLLTW